MSYKITGDSCLDRNKDLHDKVTIVPLTLSVGGEDIIDDETFNQRKFIAAVKACPEAPKSACPSPAAFMSAFEGEEDHVYCVTLSKHLSGSYNSACIAKDLYYEENPDSAKKIHIFNSDAACCGEALVALKLIELEEQGLDFDTIVKKTEDYIWNLDTLFVLETLDSLIKNGRITGLVAKLVVALNIKPIMGEDHGVIIQLDKARGMNKAMRKMVDVVAENVIDPEDKVLGITHCNCPERAEFVKNEILKRVKFRDVYIAPAAGVSTLYASDGGVVVSY